MSSRLVLIILSASLASIRVSEGSSSSPGGHSSAYGGGYNSYDDSWRSRVDSRDNDPRQYAPLVQEEQSPLPPGWKEYFDPASGQPYYHNTNDGTTTWDRPVIDSMEHNSTETDEASHAFADQQPGSKMDSEVPAASYDSSAGYPIPQARDVSESGQIPNQRTEETGGTQMNHDEVGRNETVAEGLGSVSSTTEKPSEQQVPPKAWGIANQPSDQSRLWGVGSPADASRQNQGHSAEADVNAESRAGYREQFGSGYDRRDQQHNLFGRQGTPTQDVPNSQNVPPSGSTDNIAFQKGSGNNPLDQRTTPPQTGTTGTAQTQIGLQAVQTSTPGMHHYYQQPQLGVHQMPERYYGSPTPDAGQHSAQKQGGQYNAALLNQRPQAHQKQPGPYYAQPQDPRQQLQQGKVGQHSSPLQDPREQLSHGQLGQTNEPHRGGPHGQYNAPPRVGPQDDRRMPPGSSFGRNQYAPPLQQSPNQYGSQRPPPHTQTSPYGQYQQYGGYGQPPQQQSNQLISQQTTSAVRGALGSAWQGLVGFGNRTKEVVGTATSSVVNTAKGAGQTISTTSNSLLEQAKNTFGSLFEPGPPDVASQSSYSLGGSQVSQGPPPGAQSVHQTPGSYPPQHGRYTYPQQQAQQQQGQNPYGQPPQQSHPTGMNPYTHPEYPPRYPPSGQAPPSYSGAQGQLPPSQPNRPPGANPYPPGYRPPQPRGDQAYPHDRNFPGQGGPQQYPPRQVPPPQTKWGTAGANPQPGWGVRGQAPKLPEEKDLDNPLNHPGLNHDF